MMNGSARFMRGFRGIFRSDKTAAGRRRRSASKRGRSPGFELLEPRELLTTTVFSDGFEGAFPGAWAVYNFGAGATWGDNAALSSAGSWSAFCADNGSNFRTTYDNNMNARLERQNISLADFATATLTFDLYLNSEAGWDYFRVDAYSPSTGWVNKLTMSGSSGGWTAQTINMDDVCGQNGVTVRFSFTSDATGIPASPAGAWIDQVYLTAD